MLPYMSSMLLFLQPAQLSRVVELVHREIGRKRSWRLLICDLFGLAWFEHPDFAGHVVTSRGLRKSEGRVLPVPRDSLFLTFFTSNACSDPPS